MLLGELGRASRLYPKIEESLDEGAPTGMELKTTEAYQFLRDFKSVLQEAGFEVLAPDWWGQTANRVGARLLIDSEPSPSEGGEGGKSNGGVGLHSLVNYSWQIALGDTPLTLEEFQALAKKGVPLVRINGRWVEIRPEDLERGVKFLKQNANGQATLVEALRMAHLDASDGGLPVIGVDTKGWVAEIFGPDDSIEKMPLLEQPERFQGTLRPYQRAGVSWLAFLERYGMGACLADDMGLGKTIQLIALLQAERQAAPEGERVGPTLLVAPMSVLGNWHRELLRFAPELVVHVHHGLERPHGERRIMAGDADEAGGHLVPHRPIGRGVVVPDIVGGAPEPATAQRPRTHDRGIEPPAPDLALRGVAVHIVRQQRRTEDDGQRPQGDDLGTEADAYALGDLGVGDEAAQPEPPEAEQDHAQNERDRAEQRATRMGHERQREAPRGIGISPHGGRSRNDEGADETADRSLRERGGPTHPNILPWPQVTSAARVPYMCPLTPQGRAGRPRPATASSSGGRTPGASRG